MSTISWIDHSEQVVAKSHPTLADVTNRPLNQVMQASGFSSYISSFSGFVALTPGFTQTGLIQVSGSVTAASATLSGAVTAGSAVISGLVTAGSAVVSGLVTAGSAIVSSTGPTFDIVKTGAAADEKDYRWTVSGSSLLCQFMKDDLSSSATWLTVTRSGLIGQSVLMQCGTLTIEGGSSAGNPAPTLDFVKDTGTADNKRYSLLPSETPFLRLRFVNDALSNGTDVMIWNRSGITCPSIQVFGATFELNNATPASDIVKTGAALDEKRYSTTPSGSQLLFRVVKDDLSAGTTWLAVTRSGISVLRLEVPNGTLIVGTSALSAFASASGTLAAEHNSPAIDVRKSNAAADEKVYSRTVSGSQLLERLVKDDGSSGTTWLAVTRSGISLTSVVIGVDPTGSALLRVGGTITVGDSTSVRGSFQAVSADGAAEIGSSTNHPLFLFTNGTTRWSVTTGGNLNADTTNGGWVQSRVGGAAAVARHSEVLFENAGLSTTSTTVGNSVTSFSLLANTLDANNKAIRITMAGRTATQQCTVQVKFGATAILASNVAAGDPFYIVITIARTGATAQLANGWIIRTNIPGSVGAVAAQPAETLSGAVTVDFEGWVTAGGTLSVDFCCVELLYA